MQIGVRQQESFWTSWGSSSRIWKDRSDEGIRTRIRKAQSAFLMFMPVWKDKCIRLQTKLSIFSTKMKSAHLYGSETWRWTKLLITKLHTYINNSLRKILNIRWPQVNSNYELWERTQQCRIKEGIKRRTWKWIGHTHRNPEYNYPFRLRVEPSGVQKRRTPKATLEAKCARRAPKEEYHLNRVRLRSMVDSLCSPSRAKMASSHLISSHLV